MCTKIYRFFEPILKRFLLDFPPIWDPKISKSQPKSHAKSKQKNHFKMMPKNSILASKMNEFLTFLATKIDPWGRLGPTNASKQKITSKTAPKSPKL